MATGTAPDTAGCDWPLEPAPQQGGFAITLAAWSVRIDVYGIRAPATVEAVVKAVEARIEPKPLGGRIRNRGGLDTSP